MGQSFLETAATCAPYFMLFIVLNAGYSPLLLRLNYTSDIMPLKVLYQLCLKGAKGLNSILCYRRITLCYVGNGCRDKGFQRTPATNHFRISSTA
jgi:hypothetical protein